MYFQAALSCESLNVAHDSKQFICASKYIYIVLFLSVNLKTFIMVFRYKLWRNTNATVYHFMNYDYHLTYIDRNRHKLHVNMYNVQKT